MKYVAFALGKILKMFFLLTVMIIGIGFTHSLISLFDSGLSILYSGPPMWAAIGFLAYIPIHIIFRRLILVHVFGHELTHALWAIIFGGKVKEFYVSKSQGGFTTYTGGNFLVTLAPYFFPLYSIVFFVLYKIVEQSYKPIFLILTGAGLSFHVLLTIYSIRIGQSDLKKSGIIFSLIVIYAMNCIVFGLFASDIINNGHAMSYMKDGVGNSLQIARMIQQIMLKKTNSIF